MARAYNSSNRFGVKRGSYKVKEIKYEFGGIKLGAKRNLTDTQYITQEFLRNQEQIAKAYNKELTKLQKALTGNITNAVRKDRLEQLTKFQSNYKDDFTWWSKNIKARKKHSKEGTVKIIKTFVETTVGEEVERFRRNLISGLDSAGVLSQFIEDINEPLDKNKIMYQGDGVYTYTTSLGIKFEIITNNSPLTYEVINVGEDDEQRK